MKLNTIVKGIERQYCGFNKVLPSFGVGVIAEKMGSALRRLLKGRGMTYRDLAAGLSLSEASVKRIFSENTFTLKRIEQMCAVLDVSFLDLTRLSESQAEVPQRLTSAQESELAHDDLLFVCFYLLLKKWSPDAICKHYNFSKQELERIFRRLDQLRLIELWPHLKVKLLTSSRIHWRTNGPLQKKFDLQVKAEFLAHGFQANEQRLVFIPGEMSPDAQREVLRKIDRLASELEDLFKEESALNKEKTASVGVLMAFRPWVYSSFQHCLRVKK